MGGGIVWHLLFNLQLEFNVVYFYFEQSVGGI